MSAASDASWRHGSTARTAVLLLNLGTPDAPTAPALRRYLRQFLSDRRVVELPRLLWWPLLNGVILPLRAPKSAAKYASIWTPDGSPLAVGTAALQQALGAELARRGHDLLVTHAMRYGKPDTDAALDALQTQGMTRLLALPLYPQYSATSTASALDAVLGWMRRARRQPELRTVRNYADQPAHIAALAASVRRHWETEGRADCLVMSFHGLPQRNLHRGDPYFCECQKTARLLADALGLQPQHYRVSFQSRFGRQAWLQPYTEPLLQELARTGVAKVDLICPGFAVDCLETLEEIAVEAKQAFLTAGGRAFRYISCLNADPQGVAALADLVEAHLAGWPEACADPDSRARARAAGATDPD